MPKVSQLLHKSIPLQAGGGDGRSLQALPCTYPPREQEVGAPIPAA